ncbi:MAG: metalloregulator ArsR/SmtB family transcription factor [candidate division Zixibacteria bacterium]|jgi:DNA-binding transcriptional ArsR family regulator|nr:metalloregulator ArsR/SmtB family transcription factor [candidate division Zixibacteria bacterium]
MTTDQLSATFAALADPTRRAILSRLTAGEATVQQLARPFTISQPGISKHLKVLERAGLIERGRDAQWRPCRLRARPLKDVADWVDHYRRFWEESFDRLDEYLRVLQASPRKRRRAANRKPSISRTTRKGETHARKKRPGH